MNKALIAIVLAAGAISATPITYSISVLTNLAGTPGSLDIQYNPGPTATQASTATISLFSPTATLSGPVATPGAPTITGSLLTQLAIRNDPGFNDYFVNYTFPSVITFQLTLSGAGVDTPSNTGSGSTFAFSLYDAAGTTPLKSSNVDGFLFQIDLSNRGVATFQNFATGGATVSATTSSTVPEPTTILLAPASLMLLAFIHRFRNKSF